jgi:RND family efflux transporter MFP subunit
MFQMLAADLTFADAGSAISDVQTATLQPTTWRVTEQVPATIDAEESAVLAAERAGQVVAVLYSSGQSVTAGTVLVKLDDAPEAAQLALDQARLTESQRALAREEKLIQIAGASQAALEQAQADMAEAKAQVALDNAMLSQLNIVAPFSGVLGIRKISAGDYVQQGQEVAELTQLSPLRVLFSVPQTEAGGLNVGDPFTLDVASLPSGNATLIGHISALSPQVNTVTNARDVEGAISNGNSALWPGMFGIVTVRTGDPQPAFALPASAVNDNMLGRYIYVLQSGQHDSYTVHAVYITEYSQSGDIAVVGVKGLSAGERVVALGGFNLDDGDSVTLRSP